MHYLIAMLVAGLLLWALKRRRRTPQPHPLPAIAIAAQAPKHRPALYVIFGLLALGASWFLWDAWFPEHPAPNTTRTEDSVASELHPLATVPPTEALHSSGDGCEWVKSFTREDGTSVQAHWSSKPGYAGECPLLAPKPLRQPHEKLPVY